MIGVTRRGIISVYKGDKQLPPARHLRSRGLIATRVNLADVADEITSRSTRLTEKNSFIFQKDSFLISMTINETLQRNKEQRTLRKLINMYVKRR